MEYKPRVSKMREMIEIKGKKTLNNIILELSASLEQ